MSTPPLPNPTPRTNWILMVVMLLIGLVAGYFIGKKTTSDAQAVLGDCIRRDSTVVATNVSMQSCQISCSSCMWEQNAR
jgi:hypothetical protein